MPTRVHATMKTLLVATVLATLLAFAGTQALAATKKVKVGDNFFVHRGHAPTVKVRKGTKLTWRFAGKSMHNVTVVRGPRRFRSGNRKRGTFSHKFTKRGTYKIVCTIHSGMRMTVKVH
jgi:plastocyanin